MTSDKYVYFPSRKEMAVIEKYVYGDGFGWDEPGTHGRQTCPDCQGRLVLGYAHGPIGQAWYIVCLTDGCEHKEDITDYGCW